ncbi:dTDP-glucose 4,6-dehydratase [Paenibacillus sp. J31TS4]|uniref:NAD-dependent epimerase/dehydratase family protein n=1 Tax=Paenibacillus sp. J31TS4 TaxID=2807195 RepID=UPI001B06BBD8|nr:NAD(P)-dependent oxidoreductase [Paenibacillus sp. J31TS4]GIP37317.1 dTDP-glucose 4,6-dehydratase [Paenibacillus sp. J31TS4]
MKKVLITGANGLIGSHLAEGLRQSGEYEVIATGLRGDPEKNIQQMDMTDYEQVLQLTKGVDTILHFAVNKNQTDFLGAIVPIDLKGAYHLYEAARIHQVRRVVFASSNHATGYYEIGDKVTPESPYRPDSLYGLMKGYIEIMGRLYSDKYGISSINIRIGNYNAKDVPDSERKSHLWISHADMLQLVRKCIEADGSHRFLTLYGTSGNRHNYYDIEYLEELIGYKPEHDAEAYIKLAEQAHIPIRQDETERQGGQMADRV